MSLKTKVIQGAVCSVVSVLAIAFNIDADLQTSESGLRHVANEEGCRLKPYQCSADVDGWPWAHSRNHSRCGDHQTESR